MLNLEDGKKINFFRRLKIAIFNLDEYGIFIEEKLKVAIKYMFIIVVFTSIVLSALITAEYSKELEKGLKYLQNEFPEFHFEGTKLKLEEYVEGYDEEYGVKLIADTTEDLSTEKIDEYFRKTKDASIALIILNDKILYKTNDIQNEYTFEYLDSAFQIKDLSKEDIINQYYKLGGNRAIIITGTVLTFLLITLENIIQLITYVLIVAIVGLIVGRICGIAMQYSVAINLAIYSLTVPVICEFIYAIILNLTGFEIKYFEIMYLMIAYVYMIAAILIIKADLNKQAQDLMRIKSVEEQIKDELKKKELEEQDRREKEETEKKDSEENNKEKKDSKKKEPNMEPDGSEI